MKQAVFHCMGHIFHPWTIISCIHNTTPPIPSHCPCNPVLLFLLPLFVAIKVRQTSRQKQELVFKSHHVNTGVSPRSRPSPLLLLMQT